MSLMSQSMMLLGLASVVLVAAAGQPVPTTPDSVHTHTIVTMDTSLGPIEIELFDDLAPITVRNFLQYVDAGFYNGTIFHRVMKGFMIQGGGLNVDLTPKATKPPIKNEAENGLGNELGTVAMARTGVVDSATSQFFINVANNERLNHRGPGDAFGYAVFGKVISGMDTVRRVEAAPTSPRPPHEAVPVEPVIIRTVVRKSMPRAQ